MWQNEPHRVRYSSGAGRNRGGLEEMRETMIAQLCHSLRAPLAEIGPGVGIQLDSGLFAAGVHILHVLAAATVFGAVIFQFVALHPSLRSLEESQRSTLRTLLLIFFGNDMNRPL